MCGIAGVYYFEEKRVSDFDRYDRVIEKLKHRGPDFQNYIKIKNCILFHSRLSIIDISSASHQPFVKNENYLCFNGEIFNYKQLQNKFSDLKTNGDVEVMHAILEAQSDLNQINGYFAFAFLNSKENTLTLGRDRLGIKPLYYFKDEEKFAFASELKALLEIIGPQELNPNQLYTYFRLNYSAGNESVFKNIYQLEPGTSIRVSGNKAESTQWFKLNKQSNDSSLSELLSDSVKLRLQADVPVGCFLSGGVDSSIISALATKHHQNIHTFSLGFKDDPYFDETKYAAQVAKHIHSDHHEFKLSGIDFTDNIHPFLNSIDEPFADSSALNFYILSKYTKQHVKVALSGDGADELFKGYNKHKALFLSQNLGSKLLANSLYPLSKLLPESRQGNLPNKLRQLSKFKKLIGLSVIAKQQYLAQISTDKELRHLFKFNVNSNYFEQLFTVNNSFSNFEFQNTFDIQTVLKDDMLVKADRFSMQHGLEIRNPFLDYRVVEYALNLPDSEKISKQGQKLVLQKEFGTLLPKQIFERSKKGFELPLWKWLNNELRTEIETIWLSEKAILEQGIFDYNYIRTLKKKLFSNNPGDSAAKAWALIVFQNWYLQNKHYIR